MPPTFQSKALSKALVLKSALFTLWLPYQTQLLVSFFLISYALTFIKSEKVGYLF